MARESRTAAMDSSSTFVNPVGEGADPWVIRDPTHPERYLWCMSEGNRAIAIHISSRLTSLGQKHVVWRAPSSGPLSQQVWAPELHFLDNQWYIYFAASDGNNDNHLTYVLRSKDSDVLGEYQLLRPLATGDGQDGQSPNVWAIDMTVLELQGQRYAVWSGWDAPGTDRQFLYIARLKTPTEIIPPRVKLCNKDDYLWERIKPKSRARGLNEAPQVFQSHGATFIVYSCGASWLPSGKLGLLELVGENPLDASSWKKHDIPAFEGNGVGHSCFVRSLGGEELWHVYHSKCDSKPGWRRAIHIQPMQVDSDGMPLFGTPLEAGSELQCPVGETIPFAKLPYQESFDNHESLSDWSYYGHHQFMSLSTHLHLGVVPEEPVNDYRTGEKVIFDRRLPTNYSIEVSIDFRGDKNARQAGILFRCSGVSLGCDAQRGYYVGLLAKDQAVMFGKFDDKNKWMELKRAPVEVSVDTPQRLRVRVSGDQFTVFHKGRQCLCVTDNSYNDGFAGLRVMDTHAMFSNFRIDLLSGDNLVV